MTHETDEQLRVTMLRGDGQALQDTFGFTIDEIETIRDVRIGRIAVFLAAFPVEIDEEKRERAVFTLEAIYGLSEDNARELFERRVEVLYPIARATKEEQHGYGLSQDEMDSIRLKQAKLIDDLLVCAMYHNPNLSGKHPQEQARILQARVTLHRLNITAEDVRNQKYYTGTSHTSLTNEHRAPMY